MNKVEQWKQEKHGFDVWQEMLDFAERAVPFQSMDKHDLERMKWYGVLNRKRDASGRFMLRFRLSGCELTAQQARELAFVSYEYGHGIVDLTTRAGIQIQGLAIENVPAALLRLEGCGLSAKQTGHDNVRGVFCHPLSGVGQDHLIDTRGLCRDITSFILDSRIYADLPRKFNIALDGRAQHGAHYWTQDLSYLACEGHDGRPMFRVLVGGTQGQQPKLGEHLPVLVAPEGVVDVTRAILDLFREQGSREDRNRGRFRFLVEKIGIGGVLAYLEEHLPYPLPPDPGEPSPPTGHDELIGWFPQRQPGLRSMGISVPLGRMSWEQLEGMALISKKWGDGNLRVTPEQGILIINVPARHKDAAATDAAMLGLSVHADSLVRNTVACTGSQFCNIAVTETKGQMLKLIGRLRQQGIMLHGIRIHMSGCPSSCAQHFTADIGLKGVRVRRMLGTREGFDVYLGGGIAGKVHLARPYRLGVDIDQLPRLIADVIHEYYRKRKADQTFSAFWREKLLQQEASNAGDGEYARQSWLCEGCGYKHNAEYPPVFCPSCAGLRKAFVRLEQQTDAVSETEMGRC
jgi:ferredoxin-nitrite reductase